MKLTTTTLVSDDELRQLGVAQGAGAGTDDFRAAVASEALATGHRGRGHASAAARKGAAP